MGGGLLFFGNPLYVVYFENNMFNIDLIQTKFACKQSSLKFKFGRPIKGDVL